MLPTSNDDVPERPACALNGEALLSRPLAASLLSPNSALQSKEMDGMAEMLSSDHQECINSQPVSAEQETEVGPCNALCLWHHGDTGLETSTG
jgi:hypothetical protein